jgi:hypothetical protein
MIQQAPVKLVTQLTFDLLWDAKKKGTKGLLSAVKRRRFV